MTTTLTIEQLWSALRTSGGDGTQRRIDPAHPLDLYADFELPDRPGLVAVCGTQAAEIRPLRAVRITQGVRADGRWSLRIALLEPELAPVFAALCRDIVNQTRSGVHEGALAAFVLSRIGRWRNLFERDTGGLGERALRGLFGELLVLDIEILRSLSPKAAVMAWIGPSGGAQDFLLPSGTRIEVKTAEPAAGTVRISSLGQLDGEPDKVRLFVVRAEKTGALAPGAVEITRLVSRLQERLSPDADALADFDSFLILMGWHEHVSHEAFAMRPRSIEAYEIDSTFPRVTRQTVPVGVVDVEYEILLPKSASTIWQAVE